MESLETARRMMKVYRKLIEAIEKGDEAEIKRLRELIEDYNSIFVKQYDLDIVDILFR